VAAKGRPPSIDAAQVREMKAQGLGATAIAKQLGIVPMPRQASCLKVTLIAPGRAAVAL
jgi:hypothetical protein